MENEENVLESASVSGHSLFDIWNNATSDPSKH